MKEKKSFKQIMAIAAIVLLVGMYVITLILAFVDNSVAFSFFKLSLACTFLIPVVIYLFLMFYKLSHKNDLPEDMIFADEEDDPYTEEDFKE